jgi:hypothetical protein
VSPRGTSATAWSIVPAPDDRWRWTCSSWWNENWQGKPKYSEETCPNATLSTINPTWSDLGSNPGRRGGKPATNHLSYGTAEMRDIEIRRNSAGMHHLLCTISRILKPALHLLQLIAKWTADLWNRDPDPIGHVPELPIFIRSSCPNQYRLRGEQEVEDGWNCFNLQTPLSNFWTNILSHLPGEMH